MVAKALNKFKRLREKIFPMRKELKVAIKAAQEAGEILKGMFGRVTREAKADKSLITKADLEADKIIRSIIEKHFPDHSILDEESPEKVGSEYKWIIDPLDGTTNFSICVPFFNTSIALFKKDEPIIGVVHSPFLQETFYAEIEGGAFLNDKRIEVSRNSELGKCVIGFCHGYDESSTKRIIKIFSKMKLVNPKFRQFGAAALELCYLACGRIDAFLLPGLRTWDVAAGFLIAKEAGATVTDFEGNPFTINSKDLLATNGEIHHKLLEILRQVNQKD